MGKILNSIQVLLHPGAFLAYIIDKNVHRRYLHDSAITRLTQSALTSQEPGISKEKLCDEEIVVSLTTFKQRYEDAFLAIESIMQGTVKPNRIVLYVSEELHNQPIPMVLQKQMKRGLEIRFRRDIRSYTKLIYALQDFPEAAIITIDDDIIYEFFTIEHLVNTHIAFPQMICANDIFLIPDDLKKTNRQLLQWPSVHTHHRVCQKYVFEGFAGVLYPPHILPDEVFREDVFLNICRTSDDVWFSAMAMTKGVECVYACPFTNNSRWISNENMQEFALRTQNIAEYDCQNIKRVFEKYNLY